MFSLFQEMVVSIAADRRKPASAPSLNNATLPTVENLLMSSGNELTGPARDQFDLAAASRDQFLASRGLIQV